MVIILVAVNFKPYNNINNLYSVCCVSMGQFLRVNPVEFLHSVKHEYVS